MVCDPPETYSGPDGEDISVSGDCTDAAGNITTATFTFDFDDTDPSVTVTPDRGPDHHGWYNAAVVSDTNGSDATSGLDGCDVDQTYTAPDGTNLTVSGECTDNAGNVGAGTSDAFDFDDTDPSVTVAPIGARITTAGTTPPSPLTPTAATPRRASTAAMPT